jgi:nucleotide-binding universal stress UspA family protein
MFKRILAAVGGTDASLEPARLAAQLAQHDGAGLTIVSVHRAASPVLGEPNYSDIVLHRLGEAKQVLERARQVARAEGVEQPELQTIEGDPAEAIVEIARSGGYDLIVTGTHRRGRLGTALLGSVSHAVAARAGRPVLVVPDPQPASGR